MWWETPLPSRAIRDWPRIGNGKSTLSWAAAHLRLKILPPGHGLLSPQCSLPLPSLVENSCKVPIRGLRALTPAVAYLRMVATGSCMHRQWS